MNPQVVPPSRTGSSMMWEVGRPAAGRALPSTQQEAGVTFENGDHGTERPTKPA